MTNAEKYLKDEMLLKDFISDFMVYCVRNKQDSVNLESLSLFLRTESKPTLTEDERVILRNIDKKYKYISKGKGDTELYLRKEADDTCLYIFRGYKHLFQFIKERRRIFY